MSLVYHALKEGFWPFYTFMFYSGFPALRFYSPLFYFLAGPLTLLTGGNMLLALRILLVALHLVSAFAMYAYLLRRELMESTRREGHEFGAALGAIVYLVVPWRTVYLAGLANYPESLVYVLLPLAFLALESVLDGSRQQKTEAQVRHGLLLGLWVGLLFLTHLVYAVCTLILLATWWAASNGGRADRRCRPRSEWRALGAAALAAVGVSAFFLVPFTVEQGSHRFPITHLNLTVPDWLVLLGFKSRIGGYAGNYLGLSVVVLLMLAIGAVVSARRFRFQIPALLGLAVSLFLAFGPALLRGKQYLITAGLPPERFLVLVVFFSALLAPSGFGLVRNVLSEKRIRPAAVFGAMAAVVMLDCLLVVCHFRRLNPGEFMTVRDAIYPIVRGEPHARILDLGMQQSRIDDPSRTSRLPTVGVIYGDLPTPLGLPYHQYAPRSMLHVYPWVDYIVGEIADPTTDTLSHDTHKALALMGVSHFITLPTLVGVGDAGPSFLLLKHGMNWDDRFVRAEREPPLAIGMTHQGLVLAANNVAPMPPDTLVADHSFIVARNWRRLLDTLQLNELSHSLSFIPAIAGTRRESLDGLPALQIDSTRIRHQDVVTGFSVNADCFLRVAVSHYPELELRLDGEPVPFFETADHFTCIRCPAGAHVLHVGARLGGLRLATLLLSLVSLPAVLVLILRRKRP
jgi:hypothetical protein